jgi:transposase-like protein|tara:strand:- start:33 stop:269 length:237 start_codon:yes stop_codon:yes gene_type:complete
MTKPSPFRYFKTSPEVIRLAVMMYVQFPLSLRNVEDLLHERGVDVSHETVSFGGTASGQCLRHPTLESFFPTSNLYTP